MDIQYIRKGDYLYPNLTVTQDPAENIEIGKYGTMHMEYLRTHQHGAYRSHLYMGDLRRHCARVNDEAMERMEFLMSELMERFRNQAPDQTTDIWNYMAWKNNIEKMAEETVLEDLVFTL